MSELALWAAANVELWRPYAYLALASIVVGLVYLAAWVNE